MDPAHIIELSIVQLYNLSTTASLAVSLEISDVVKHVPEFAMQDTNLFHVETSNVTVIVVLEGFHHALLVDVGKFQQAKPNFMTNTLNNNEFHNAHTCKREDEWSTRNFTHVIHAALIQEHVYVKVVQEFATTAMMLDHLV